MCVTYQQNQKDRLEHIYVMSISVTSKILTLVSMQSLYVYLSCKCANMCNRAFIF